MLAWGLSPPTGALLSQAGSDAPKETIGAKAPNSSNLTLPHLRKSQPKVDRGSRVHLTVLARQTTERGWSYPSV